MYATPRLLLMEQRENLPREPNGYRRGWTPAKAVSDGHWPSGQI